MVSVQKLTEQFDRLKASVKTKEKPPPASVNKAGSSASAKLTGTQPVKAHGDISRIKGILVAVLKLSSPCQGLVTLEDTTKSNRIPGNKVIIYGIRHLIDLKILMHRQGHRLGLVQKDKEVEDDLKLIDLSESVRLHVVEEPSLRSGPVPRVQYTMNQGLIGHALAGDPKIPCWLPPQTPRFVSCIHSTADHSIVILNFEGTPLVLPEPRGAHIEQIRNAFQFGRKDFIPWGATRFQWTG